MIYINVEKLTDKSFRLSTNPSYHDTRTFMSLLQACLPGTVRFKATVVEHGHANTKVFETYGDCFHAVKDGPLGFTWERDRAGKVIQCPAEAKGQPCACVDAGITTGQATCDFIPK